MLASFASADPRPSTSLGLLGSSLDPIGIRSSPQLRAFASQLSSESTQLSFNSPSAVNSISAIDSTMESAGPIFLAHPATVGKGKTNVSLLSQTSLVDNTFPQPGRLLIEDRQGQQFAAAIGYRLQLRTTTTALAISHGITDSLDVSLLLMGVSSDLQIDTSRKLAGSPKITATESSAHTGFGDITVRLKQGLPTLGPVHSALTLEGQFPTGDKDNLLGAGDWYLTPTLTTNTSLLGGKADITVNLGLDFDISNSAKSQATYSLGGSYVLVDRRLIGVIELMGRSDLDAQLDPGAMDALYVLPNGDVETAPLFGFDTGRKDYFDLSFGLRVVVMPGVIGFVSAIYQLNEKGLHGGAFIPTIGIGGNF